MVACRAARAGRWSSGSPGAAWTINFAKKGSYTIDGPFRGLIRGKNTFAGTTMTFNHERNSSDETCGNVLGKYRFSVTGNTLKLTRISDKCEAR